MLKLVIESRNRENELHTQREEERFEGINTMFRCFGKLCSNQRTGTKTQVITRGDERREEEEEGGSDLCMFVYTMFVGWYQHLMMPHDSDACSSCCMQHTVVL